MSNSPKITTKSPKINQIGASIWVILPWLIALALATALVLLVATKNKPETITKNEPPTSASVTAWQPTIATNKTHPDTPTPISSYHDAVSRAAISVVNIYTTQKVQNPYVNDPVLQRFFEYYGQGQESAEGASSLGSGVIISKDGYIITNAHVIEKADEITVALNDGRKAKASIIGSDTESDLAVIKVQMDNLTPLAFRKEPILVGDVALAIGNPFGVGQTVTQGIISATGRTGLGVTTFEDFIQTDAAINPGNSGGALVDANGALIGINTVIYSRSGGSMGIGFAIPTSIVEQVMNALISTGKVSRGWLGIEIVPISQNPAKLEESTGVTIAGIMKDGPADKAGLQAGDVVVSIDGTPTKDPNTLIGIISRKAPNSNLVAMIKRGGQEQQVNITVGERPSVNATNQQSQLSKDEQARLNQLLEELNRLQNRR